VTSPGSDKGAVCLHVVVLNKGAHAFFQNSIGDLKILGASVQKFDHPEFVHRWLKEPQGYILKRS